MILSYCGDIDSLSIECLGIETADIPTDPATLPAIIRCGKALQAHSVDSVMLGCAGMASYVDQLQEVLNVPVIESVAAAVQMLLQTTAKEEATRNATNQSTAIA